MLLNSEQQNVITSSNIQTTSSFNIKASAKAFTILSDSLYGNKIEAIIREIGCNAVDAHVMVNTPTRPFDVKLPDIFDQIFYIRDYGPGLSHRDIVGDIEVDDDGNERYSGGLYNTYFESTKTGTNDFIGALGLGSKSPFSYVANFLVESFQDGVHRVYSCFKDSNNLPAVVLLATNTTTEENGLKVSLSVKELDVSKFLLAARNIFSLFEVAPNIIGDPDWKPIELKEALSGSNWKLLETSSDYVSIPRIVQGNIGYPLDVKLLQELDELSDDAKRLLNIPLLIYVNIGDVDIAASRESLSYDKQTIQTVCQLLQQCYDELYSQVIYKFSGCNTHTDAVFTFNKLRRSMWPVIGYGKLDNKISIDGYAGFVKFPWSSYDSSSVSMVPQSTTKLSVAHYYTTCIFKRSTLKAYHDGYYHITISYSTTNHVIVIDRYNLSNPKLLKQLQDSNLYNPSTSFIIISPKSKKNVSELEIQSYLTELGSSMTVFETTQPVTVKAVSQSRSRSANYNKVLVGEIVFNEQYGIEANHRTYESTDKIKDGYILEQSAHRFYINNQTLDWYDLRDLLPILSKLGSIDKDKRIFTFPTSLSQKKKSILIDNNISLNNILSTIGSNVPEEIKVAYGIQHKLNWLTTRLMRNAPLPADFYRDIDVELYNRSVDCVQALKYFTNNSKIDWSISHPIIQQILDLVTKYPLLSAINGESLTDPIIMNELEKYKNIIDNTL
jgi:hypothetical protein